MRLTTLAAQPAASGGMVEKSIPPIIQAVVSLLLVFQRRFGVSDFPQHRRIGKITALWLGNVAASVL
jgi:hypothetical protein